MVRVFAHELARRLAGTGTTANVVQAGFVATNLGKKQRQQDVRDILSNDAAIPNQRSLGSRNISVSGIFKRNQRSIRRLLF